MVDGLPRRITLPGAVAVVVGIIIGSGIFRSPAGIADRLPGPLALLGVWVAGGALTLCGALALAEVAARVPRTGGVYAFIREGWGPLPAFLFGWAELVVIRAAANGALAVTFGEYTCRLVGLPLGEARWIAAVALVVVAAVNIAGVRWGTTLQGLTTLAKCAGLLVVVFLALVLVLPRTGGHFTPLAPEGSFSLDRFGLALVSVLWAYDGWADLGFVAGEVRDPQRTLPRALIAGTLATIAIYVAANVAYLSVLPIDELRRSPLVAAEVGARVLGAAGVTLVGATVVVSTLGTLNGAMLTTPRVFYAMAADGLLFRRIAAVHPRFQTPYVAIAIGAALGVVFVLLRSFEQLADAFVVAIAPFYALAVLAIYPLRRRGGPAGFRAPGYPVLPAIFALAMLALLFNAAADPTTRWGTLGVLGVIAAGIPVYRLVARRALSKRNQSAT